MDNRRKIDELTGELLARKFAEVVKDEQAGEFDRFAEQAAQEGYDRPALDKRLQRLVAQKERRDRLRGAGRAAKKPAAALCVFLFAAFVVVLSVEAFHIPFFNLFIQEDETHTVYGVALTRDDLEAAGVKYAPSYLPQGYELVSIQEGNITVFTYQDMQGDSIIVEQSGIEVAIAHDSETERRVVDLNGVSAYLITGKGLTVITWDMGGIFMTLVTTLDDQEAIEIADSFYPL